MTPRENILRLCRGQSPDWIPFTLDVGGIPGFTDTIQQRFQAETGADDPAEYFDYDLRVVSVPLERTVDPTAYHDALPAGTDFDPWGVGHWAGGAADTYARTYPPFDREVTPAEIAAYPAPICNDHGVAARVAAYHARGYPVVGYAGSIYEWSWWLRGMSNFMMDLLAEPKVAAALVDKVAGLTTQLALASARCGIDILAFYDDAGMQTGMQIAPELWRTVIKPAWTRVIGTLRAHYPETILFLHSCGAITPIVPDIVELGFDILHPIQPECMDAAAVKRTFGHAIVPCATLGAQGCFAFGTPADVTREVRRLRRNLGADRRCLLCPSNLIQPETPWENILAFAAAARER